MKIIGSLFVLIIIGVGYYVITTNKIGNTSEEPTATSTEEVVEDDEVLDSSVQYVRDNPFEGRTVQQDVTSQNGQSQVPDGWSVYTDTTRGISFQYPKNYSVSGIGEKSELDFKAYSGHIGLSLEQDRTVDLENTKEIIPSSDFIPYEVVINKEKVSVGDRVGLLYASGVEGPVRYKAEVQYGEDTLFVHFYFPATSDGTRDYELFSPVMKSVLKSFIL